MAQIQCNFYSYSLGYPVDIAVTLPSFTSCNLHMPHTHALPAKFPVLYLLHGYGNDYKVWQRYTSVERYAEEHRMPSMSKMLNFFMVLISLRTAPDAFQGTP